MQILDRADGMNPHQVIDQAREVIERIKGVCFEFKMCIGIAAKKAAKFFHKIRFPSALPTLINRRSDQAILVHPEQ